MASLGDIFSSGPADEAAASKKWGFEKGAANYLSDIQQGTNEAKKYYDTAQTRFDPLQTTLQTGQRGYDLYADLSGANGPEGYARAKSMFQTSPGFEFRRKEGEEATLRNAGRLGGPGLASGNTLIGLQERGDALAGKEYGDWVSRLSPYLQVPGQQLALGAARSGLDTGQGQTEFLGRRLMGEAARRRDEGQGQADADAALADYNASANMWGAGMKGVDYISKLLGLSGGGGGGGGLQSLLGGGGGAGAANAGKEAAMAFV